MLSLTDVQAAARRIAGQIEDTPFLHSRSRPHTDRRTHRRDVWWRLPVKLAKELATHRRRVDLLAQFRANRQRGMIDETTLSIMRHVGMELEFALEHLTRTRELVFDFDEGAHRASMSWDEGALVTDFWTNDPRLSLMAGTLSLRQSYPDTIVIGSIGRRLGALIDHPLLSRDAMITHACSDRSTIIELTVPRRPIPDL